MTEIKGLNAEELELKLNDLFRLRCLNSQTTKEYSFEEYERVKEAARNYQEPDKFTHCLRVAYYVLSSSRSLFYSKVELRFVTYLALCHDLFEDTDISHHFLGEKYGSLYDGIELLTKKDDETYPEYCDRLESACAKAYGDKDNNKARMSLLAWDVKLADMKDHLVQTETLTDRLKAKYLEGMAYLL